MHNQETPQTVAVPPLPVSPRSVNVVVSLVMLLASTTGVLSVGLTGGLLQCGSAMAYFTIGLAVREAVVLACELVFLKHLPPDVDATMAVGAGVRLAGRVYYACSWVGGALIFVAASWLGRVGHICAGTGMQTLAMTLFVAQVLRASMPLIGALVIVVSVIMCLPMTVRVLSLVGVVSQPARLAAATDREIERLPTVLFEDGLKLEHGAPECAICLSPYVAGEKLKLVPCGQHHHFHESCLSSWLRLQRTCPLCRRLVIASPQGLPGTLPTNPSVAPAPPPV